MGRRTLDGNEAVAWAAAEAGVDYVAHYPGSPVTGIVPALRAMAARHALPIKFNDALNEHVAALAAAGASLCGARSLLVMKHVGLNIASDPLHAVAYSGVRGGQVIVVGTDPGASSSTSEQDVHWFVPSLNFPLLEPTRVRDVHRAVIEAFELSERVEVPVLIFLPARLCTQMKSLELPDRLAPSNRTFRFLKDPARHLNVGDRAVLNHRLLRERIDRLAEETAGVTALFDPRAPLGLITRGTTYPDTFEAVEALGLHDRVALLNLERVHPLPRPALREFLAAHHEVVVIEDQDGFLERQIKFELGGPVAGKAHFPPEGEITGAQVRGFLARRFGLPRESHPPIVELPERTGAFCEGCPHRASFFGIDRALAGRDGVIGGDIGCSSLPPFRADWLLCMNAGIGLSQGMSHLGGGQTVVSTGGEGSFFHGGLLSLMSAVENDIDLLHVVFDNRSIAMTGGQASPTRAAGFRPRALLEAIGVRDVVELSAFEPTRLARELAAASDRRGVRVVWVSGNCAREPDEETIRRRESRTLLLHAERCDSCTLCFQELGCPAIDTTPRIDPDRCMRCGACLDVCPNGAIELIEQEVHAPA